MWRNLLTKAQQLLLDGDQYTPYLREHKVELLVSTILQIALVGSNEIEQSTEQRELAFVTCDKFLTEHFPTVITK